MITRFDMQSYEMEAVEAGAADPAHTDAARLALRLQPVGVEPETGARRGIPADIAWMPVEQLLERF